MSDGAKIAATYYLPNGAPPGPGWPSVLMLHGLGENRSDETNALGMSINTVAETQLAPQGYAVLTLDARGHGQSEGLVGVDGPREIQDVRELVAWLTSQPAIHPGRIGAFGYSYGGGAVWRAAAKGSVRGDRGRHDWTDLLPALAPELARSGVVLGFWNSIAARAAPGGRLGGERRSCRTEPRRCARLRGRAFDPTAARADQGADLPVAGPPRLRHRAGARALARLTVPKRLYLGDFGHAPAPLPEGELEASSPTHAAGSTGT